ncbi:D-alanine--D-alanine ligase [Aquicoccus porphyridii]|uniref:D-alanine--D-alanine ligase n=1 Tax=Aquicoccus porphyridii TaxID=1852029 RepID=A0A5A9ZBP1_9RHOB|nr:D-alanine--D-alanine ligase [Aquicoccus porphyridii]KAA0914644.1 D-alanine--D-alanine ligase [Aquicoccus porphyridii]RAI53262.1 D-alanine--D-alanine ligase [Rhodobacteraceae bacterium AsT-22]
MSGGVPPKVVVLMGGPSAEREVSLATGKGCGEALRSEGFDVVELDAGRDLVARLDEIRPDVVFNALHGRWGEDGCVQGMLEWLGLPYTHSGVLASALAMDKQRSKEVYRAAGLPVVESVLARREDVSARHVMAPPYVVKPYNEGSSVGVYIVHEAANGPPQLAEDMPDVVMVETYAPGRELTTTVMGGEAGDPGALGVTDIVTDGWYDYHAKYSEGGSRHVVPADLPAEIYDTCLEYALRAHRALGCRGVTRTDFRWDEARGLDGLVLLETNTQPGMTPTSLANEQAETRGISFGALCRWMVEDASCNR